MFNPLSVDVAEMIRRERLEEAKPRQVVQWGAASDPIERGRYIKAFYRQLLEELEEAENRARRREAAADRGLP